MTRLPDGAQGGLPDHLGDRLAALVDGELDHGTRERLLVHLAHCEPCRRQVEGQRRLKAQLAEVGRAPLTPSEALAERLRALAEQAPPLPPRTPPRPPRTPVGLPLSRPGGPRRPRPARGSARPPSRVLGRRSATAGALLVLGLAGTLALGAPAAPGPAPALDPASDALVADFVGATTGGQASLTEVQLLTPVDRTAPRAEPRRVPLARRSASPSPALSLTPAVVRAGR